MTTTNVQCRQCSWTNMFCTLRTTQSTKYEVCILKTVMDLQKIGARGSSLSHLQAKTKRDQPLLCKLSRAVTLSLSADGIGTNDASSCFPHISLHARFLGSYRLHLTRFAQIRRRRRKGQGSVTAYFCKNRKQRYKRERASDKFRHRHVHNRDQNITSTTVDGLLMLFAPTCPQLATEPLRLAPKA